MKPITKIFVSGLLLAFASVAGLAAPAAADSSDCTSGRMCLWDDHGYDDSLKQFSSSDSSLHTVEGSSFNDKASSVWNRSSVAWVLYDDTGYSDTSVCVKANGSSYNLGSQGFGDKASSIKKLTNNICPSGVSRIIY